MKNITGFTTGIHKIWWVPLITGLIALGLGVWCFCSPETSLTVFAYVFAAGLVIAGILNCSYSIANRQLHTNWSWSLILGLLEIVCGVWLLTLSPATLAISFAFAVGIWLWAVAINSIGEAIFFARFNIIWTILMVVLLVASIALVCVFLFNPIFGGLIGWMWLGCSLLLFGIWRIALAFKIKSLAR